MKTGLVLEGRAFVLAPPEPLAVSRTERSAEKLRAAHRLGYETAKAKMWEWKAFLAK